ncbi:hypothetical protein VI817_010173 [Penicillium citrinum]|nr:hypothetical protein VI817_010173 [Penicillium citrinum]
MQQIWNHAASFFSRKHYQGVSRNGSEDDQVELTAEANENAPSLRSRSSAFSLASSLTSTFRYHPTFGKNSIKKNPSLNEDVTFLELNPRSPDESERENAKSDLEQSHPDDLERDKRWIDGVYMCAKAASIVFLLNLIFIGVSAGLASRFPENSGFGSSAVIYRGVCGVTKRWDTALHLIINVLSTCILAASNYCMQTLVAPTREEVDAHHAMWKWLDIGSASVKNLFAIERYRLVLWLILMITATPFHLMYNSIVFESLSTNEFGIVVGPKDLNSSNINDVATPALKKCFSCPAPYDGDYAFTSSLRWTDFANEIANGNYDRIPLSECKKKSMTTATGVRGIVALASNLTVSQGGDSAFRMTDVDNTDIQSSNDYFQGDKLPSIPFSNLTGAKGANANCYGSRDIVTRYVPMDGGGFEEVSMRNTEMIPIEECLVIKADEHCQLLYSPPICLTIMLAAFAKVTAMFLAAHIGRSRSPPLLTIGDAVASFMKNQDPTTKGLCWISGSDVRKGGWVKVNKAGFQAVLQNDQSGPITYRRFKKRAFWGRAASGWRWAATLFMCFLCIIIGCYLFSISLRGGLYGDQQWFSAETFKNWFSSDVDLSDENIIGGDIFGLSMLASVVVANIPQLAITISYYCYNAVLTSMLAASEYNSYGANRKSLRVTWPVKGSQQRSTYYLSVPYKYGVPVLILYMLLHYLVSQSIFYILLIAYNPQDVMDTGTTISSLGYSSMPIFLSILVGTIMVLLLIVLAFRRFKSNMPIPESSSVAISAACHLPKGEDGNVAVLEKLKWGETPVPAAWIVDTFDDEQKRHCSFSSLEVQKPSLMSLYA